MKNSFHLLLLDHPLAFYCILDSSAKPALVMEIASLQKLTHKAKCTLWAFLQYVFHLYVHTIYAFVYEKCSMCVILEHKTGINLTVSSTQKKSSKNCTCFILRRFGLFLIHLQSKKWSNTWQCQQFKTIRLCDARKDNAVTQKMSNANPRQPATSKSLKANAGPKVMQS